MIFLKNEIIRSFDEPKVGPELTLNILDGNVKPGVSIGIQNSSAGSSTLGGIIELRFSGSILWQSYGLSCFHCVYHLMNHRQNLDKIAGAKNVFKHWEYHPIC